jgi:metal-dependent amidase/aminoacylase/carboxypeptidase family protein
MMNSNLDEVCALIDTTRALRRDFHRHPELDFDNLTCSFKHGKIHVSSE